MTEIATQRRAAVAARQIRAQERDSLAVFLGWFSVALGSAQLAAPRALCRLVGASGKGRSALVMRAMGARELTQGLGILTRARPTAWLWSRVAGDAVDLSLLGLVFAQNRKRRGRTVLAIANVAAVTAPDVFESIHLSRESGEPQAGKQIRKSITISRPQNEVEAALGGAQDLQETIQEQGADVRLERAPGDRGTEIVVEWVEQPPLGELGAVAKKLSGGDLATELADGLRRLKQQIETGQVVRSDAVPQGHLLSGQLKQRPAQPLEEKEAVA
jgi:hypothetical protein